MARTIRLLIAYDGTAYHGWQRQCQGEPTIQAVLEERLQILCGHALTLHGAGRTDAGVHAQGMVAHFHTPVAHPLVAFSKGLNSLLPPDIRIIKAQEALPGFHSRFSACAKLYRYDFYTGEVMPPVQRLYMGHMPGTFQPEPARLALHRLLGRHDFTSFERAGSRDRNADGGRGAVRTLLQTGCQPMAHMPGGWSLVLLGDGFLRQMVRNIAGPVIASGQGKGEPDSMTAILDAKDRRQAGQTAPACGLFLERVLYPPLD